MRNLLAAFGASLVRNRRSSVVLDEGDCTAERKGVRWLRARHRGLSNLRKGLSREVPSASSTHGIVSSFSRESQRICLDVSIVGIEPGS